jgi:hypothetical protein
MLARVARPLLAGVLITLLPLVLSEPIGRAAGLCTPDFGCSGVLFFAGIPAGILAALVVARWWDLLELAVGVWLGGAAYGTVITALGSEIDLAGAASTILITVPFGAAVFVGFLGLPVFVILGLIRWAARRHGGGGAADRTA